MNAPSPANPQGGYVEDFAEKQSVSRVTIYKYLEGAKSGATTEKLSTGSESLKLELMRIELDSTKRQLELYKRDCTRLQAMLEE